MTEAATARLRVWDPLVRGLHGTLAGSMLVAWASGHWQPEHDFELVHHGAGYAALAVVALRLPWGWLGTRYARFRQFVRGPSATWRYARQVWAGIEPRHLGHNPLGGWMVVALLALTAALGLTGWLYTTDWLWGYGWLLDLHAALAWALALLVPLHVAGVVLASRRHRENLVRAMVDGRKRAPAPGDVA